MYGDVQRVKILFQKKSSALVQIADANQANQGFYKQLILKLNFIYGSKTLLILKNKYIFQIQSYFFNIKKKLKKQ